MSERERWIVYPLLFLALGAALRDKLMQQTRAEQLVCRRLVLVNEAGEPVAGFNEGALRLEALQANTAQIINTLQAGRIDAAQISARQPAPSTLQQAFEVLRQYGLLQTRPAAPLGKPKQVGPDIPAGEQPKGEKPPAAEPSIAEPPTSGQ